MCAPWFAGPKRERPLLGGCGNLESLKQTWGSPAFTSIIRVHNTIFPFKSYVEHLSWSHRVQWSLHLSVTAHKLPSTSPGPRFYLTSRKPLHVSIFLVSAQLWLNLNFCPLRLQGFSRVRTIPRWGFMRQPWSWPTTRSRDVLWNAGWHVLGSLVA